MPAIRFPKWKYFSLDTDPHIACPCCGEFIQDDLFEMHMALLDYMRGELGFPIAINSGHRCAKHNKEVGGKPESMHLLFATDVRPADNDKEKLALIYDSARKFGFRGVGKYDTFIHLDLRDTPAGWEG